MKKTFLIILIVFLCLLWKPNNEGQTIIKFSSWGSQSEISLLLPLIKEFESQHPNTKVEFLHIPQSYFQKIHLLFASKLAPDVIFINNYYLPKYAHANLLEDLTGHIDKKQYFPEAIKALSYNNKIYATPRDVSNIVVYYNKNLFDKHNIPYPKENWTFSEFLDIAKLFAQKGVWGISYETEMIYWYPYILSNNAYLINPQTKKINMNSPNLINTLNFYADLANKYGVAPKKSDSASLTMAQLFLQEKLAMHISGRWLVPKYRQEANFDWDVTTFPHGESGSRVNIDASGYALCKTSKNKKIALEFIKFISSQDSLKLLAQSGLIIPARKDVAFSDVFLNSKLKPKNSQAYINAINTGVTQPISVNHQELTDLINTILEPLFLGKIKAQEIFTPELSDKLNQYAF